MPLYMNYLGVEAIGLIGFFVMIQAWFQLMDFGLGPTLSREVARYRAGVITKERLRMLFTSLQLLFGVVAMIGAVAAITLAPSIATSWIQSGELTHESIEEAVVIMGLAIPFRWMCSLYRGGIVGFEKISWMACFNAGIATVKSLGVLGAFAFFGASTTVFFMYQMLLAIVELVVLYVVTHRLIPVARQSVSWMKLIEALKGISVFSAKIALTGVIWIVTTQLDKLLLSYILTLREYGNLTIAVTASGGILLLSAPIGQALMPMLTRLHASSKSDEAIDTYRRFTRMSCVAVLPLTLMLVFFPGQVLLAWTGNSVTVRDASNIMSLYAVGNFLLVLSSFPFYLQFASGKLTLHVLGSLLLLIALPPAIWIAARSSGAAGAGFAWTALMTIYFVLWVGISHARTKKGLHKRWLIDITTISLPCTMGALLFSLVEWPDGRVLNVAMAIGIWMALTSISAAIAWTQTIGMGAKRWGLARGVNVQ